MSPHLANLHEHVETVLKSWTQVFNRRAYGNITIRLFRKKGELYGHSVEFIMAKISHMARGQLKPVCATAFRTRNTFEWRVVRPLKKLFNEVKRPGETLPTVPEEDSDSDSEYLPDIWDSEDDSGVEE